MTKPTTTKIPTSQLMPGMKLWVQSLTASNIGTVYEVRGAKKSGNGYSVALKNGIAMELKTITEPTVEIVK